MYITFETNCRFSSITSNDTALIRRVLDTRIAAARRAKIMLTIDIYTTRISDSCEELGQDDVWVGGWSPEDGWKELTPGYIKAVAEACDKATTSAERTAIQQQYEDGCITLGQRNEALAAL